MNYGGMANMAATMITQYGQQVTWRKVNNVPSADQPWKGEEGQPVDATVSMIFLSQGDSLTEALQHFVRGTDVVTGAPMALIAPQTFSLLTNDVVIRDGNTLVIASIDEFNPGGVPLMYTVRFS